MTIDDVKKRLQDIRDNSNNDEGSHIREDRLRDDLLRAIADGKCNDPEACAKEALKSNRIDFSRWYA